MITLIEITQTIPSSPGQFFYFAPFVYQSKLTVPADFTSYFDNIFGADVSGMNRSTRVIKRVSKIGNNYNHVTSTIDCVSQEKSFFFDFDTQMLYIHLEHDSLVSFADFRIYTIIGLTDSGEREYNGIAYRPKVLSIPSINETQDPVQKKAISFSGGSIDFNNGIDDQKTKKGFFDNGIVLKGQDVYILVGDETDPYENFITIFQMYIENQKISMEKNSISVKDLREKYTTSIPTERFGVADYPNIGTDKIDQIKPIFLGYGKNVPGICIDEDSGVGNKTFRFSDTITSLTKVESRKNDKWVVVTPVSINNNAGTIVLSLSDSHVDGDITRGILSVRATGTFENYNNPADQIAYLNSRYLNIEFTTSNYDITEWNNEKQLLANTGFYLDSPIDLFQVIKNLQNGSDVFFSYEINGTLITLRIDNPNRSISRSIQNQEIKNNGTLEKNSNFTLYYSSASIDYDKDYVNDSFNNHTDETFKNEVLTNNGGKESIYDESSLLYLVADAQNKASILLDDTKDDKGVWEIKLKGKDYLSIRNYDILTIDTDDPGEIINTDYYDDIVYDVDAIDSIETDENILDFINFTQNNIERVIINNREFDGIVRCQVIGRKIDFLNEEITLTLREKPYSQVFFNIKGV